MSNLFLILSLLSIVALFIGLIKPSLVVRWGEKRTRPKALLVYGLSTIVFFILFGVTVPPTAQPTTAPNNTSNSASSNPSPPANSSKSDSAPTQTAPAPATPPAPSVKTWEAGMYKIGTDMPAGEYVLIADGDAYFQLAKDSTGTLESLVANDNFINRSILTVKAGQYLTLQSCAAYALKDAPKAAPQDGYLPEGMYKVGVDLPAGEYKVTADGDGYSEVSKDSSHSLNGVIANDNFQGDKYITVKAGQYLKLSRAKLKLN